MRKFTLFMMSLFLMLGTAMAQNYSLTETGISSEELNAKTAPTLIAIKNLSATNNYYFVGNTGAVPYSTAEFSDAAVFVWQPVQEGVAGSYYLMKLDGTYMQATSPKDFGTVEGAAVFTTTNPTTSGTGSTEFNGDGDSQAFIVDEALLVRFVNAAGTWINVQNGDAGTPVYNSGKGGWTIHHIYAVEEAAVEPEPEVTAGFVHSNTELTLVETTEYPEGITTAKEAEATGEGCTTGIVKSAITAVNAPAAGNVTVAFQYQSGNHKLVMLGVDVLDLDGNVVKGDYHYGFTGGNTQNNTYTIEGIEAGDYQLRYFFCHKADDHEAGNQVAQITVTGLNKREAVEPEPEPEPELGEGEVYIYHIKAKDAARGALYATAESTHLTHCGATYGNYHNKDIAVNAEDINQQFVFVEYEGVQYLYSLGAQKFAVKDGQFIKLTENPEGFVTVVDSDVEGYKNILFNGENKLNFSGGYTHGCVANYETPDDGNRLTFTKAGAYNATELVAAIEAYLNAEPEAPFEVVAVTPTEAVAELTTVTVEFSEEIEGTFDMMGMTQIYLGTRSNGCSFEVNGKVLTITPFNAINTPGEYKLVIPEGLITRKSNGEAVTMNGEYVFTVKEATVEPEPEVIPAANKSYTVVAEGHTNVSRPQWAINDEGTAFVSTGNTTVSTDAQKQFAFVTYEEAIYIYSISAKKFVMKDASLSDKNPDAVQLTELDNGKFFFKFDADHNVNIGGSGQMAIDWWSTIDGGNQFTLTEAGDFDATEALALLNTTPEPEAPFEVVAVTPTEAVAELTTVTVEFSEEIEGTFDMMGMTQIYLGTRSNGCSFEVNGKVLTITPFNAINTPGEYKLVIPEGLITRKSNGEAVTMNGEYVFTVKEAEAPFEVVAVTPTEAVEELTTVTVEFSEEIEGTFDMMGMTQIYLGTRSNGCSFEVNGKVLTITPFNAINTPGEYKLVIPEGLITRKSNGEAVTMNGEYVFTVKEATVEPEPEEPAAGIEVGKHYRIKSTSNGDYLTIGDTNENQYGHVHGAALDEANDNQVFTFIAVEGQENTYYVQSVAGKYFSYEGTGAGWNVNGTDDATKAHALTFEAAEGELQYLIKCYNASKSDYKYFKYEYVNASGKYHPFNDADLGGAEVWTLEEVAVVEPEPEEKDENTIALIESANELLANEGVGYPATTPREALKAAIAAAEEKPDTEAGTALQAAIDAYYATTDVVLPEGDKVYSLTMVAKNGNKFYLNYTGSDIAMVARTTDEELPNSAKFAAEDNGDGTVSLKTIDGKYLVYHSKYAGLDWLQGRGDTDGLQETKDEMTNITFAKMVNGNKVEATGNEQIFGMLTWYGKRGYDTGKSEDCYGYMVLKTDGSDYDGASVPFWNDGYSSAFIVEETEYIAEPLNVVAVTPAEDEVVNSLREITIEFDAEIAVKELSGTERIYVDYMGWKVYIYANATANGNVLTLVTDSEIKDSGKHTLVIPAGVVTRVSDGVAYEGGTFTFTVEKAAVVVEPLTVVAVTPAESVEKLETITIEFSDKVDVPATASGKFTIADADGNNVATLYAWDAAVDGKVVTLTLTEAITTAGEYTFSFAEGLVTRQGDGATCAYTCTINVTGVVGIDSIYGEAGDSVIYDITGRKIEKITEGGIYIVNGKKVLVK